MCDGVWATDEHLYRVQCFSLLISFLNLKGLTHNYMSVMKGWVRIFRLSGGKLNQNFIAFSQSLYPQVQGEVRDAIEI